MKKINKPVPKNGLIFELSLSLKINSMKFFKQKMLLAALPLFLISGEAQAQGWRDRANQLFGNSGNTTNSTSGNLSNTDATTALRQALDIAAQNAGSRLHNVNGYFGNQLIKIIMPPEAQKVESALRSVGMGDVVDKAILSMNRAAEDAAIKAVPIFLDAIKGMSIQDGISIVKGGSGAATNYLKQKTTLALTNAFRPLIEQSLHKTNATAYWKEVFTFYNKLPIVRTPINPDLTGYVTDRSLHGLFVTIADEENKIRTNPAAQVTDLLKKVFGNKG